jgi:hypothetical protein
MQPISVNTLAIEYSPLASSAPYAGHWGHLTGNHDRPLPAQIVEAIDAC